MASVITAVMERLGCQEIQIWGHHLNRGDQVSFPQEKSDEPEGGSGIASSLGLAEARAPSALPPSGRRGAQAMQGTGLTGPKGWRSEGKKDMPSKVMWMS